MSGSRKKMALGAGLGALLLASSCLSRPPPRPHKEPQVSAVHEPAGATDEKASPLSAEDLTARYTLWLVIATLVLAAVAGGQLYMFRVQLGLMRDDSVAKHRPRLRIRNVVVIPPKVSGYHESIFHPGHPVGGRFFVVNHGDTPADLVDTYSRVYLTTTGLPMDRPYEHEEGIASKVSIRPGTARELLFESSQFISERESNDVLTGGNHSLYVMGWISYEDRNKVLRRTAFCRVYDPITKRFISVDDPDYEHEE